MRSLLIGLALGLSCAVPPSLANPRCGGVFSDAAMARTFLEEIGLSATGSLESRLNALAIIATRPQILSPDERLALQLILDVETHPVVRSLLELGVNSAGSIAEPSLAAGSEFTFALEHAVELSYEDTALFSLRAANLVYRKAREQGARALMGEDREFGPYVKIPRRSPGPLGEAARLIAQSVSRGRLLFSPGHALSSRLSNKLKQPAYYVSKDQSFHFDVASFCAATWIPLSCINSWRKPSTAVKRRRPTISSPALR